MNEFDTNDADDDGNCSDNEKHNHQASKKLVASLLTFSVSVSSVEPVDLTVFLLIY